MRRGQVWRRQRGSGEFASRHLSDWSASYAIQASVSHGAQRRPPKCQSYATICHLHASSSVAVTAITVDSRSCQAESSEASAEDAVSDKLSSDKLSLIAGANEIARLGHVGNELRKGDAVVAPPFVTIQPKFRDDDRYRDLRRLMAEQLPADSVFCTGFRAYRLQLRLSGYFSPIACN